MKIHVTFDFDPDDFVAGYDPNPAPNQPLSDNDIDEMIEVTLGGLRKYAEGVSNLNWEKGSPGWAVVSCSDEGPVGVGIFPSEEAAKANAWEQANTLIMTDDEKIEDLVRVTDPDWAGPWMIDTDNAWSWTVLDPGMVS